MENAIVIAILVVLIGGAIWYIVKAKKNGAKCIGCPSSGSCSSGSCNCGCSDEGESEAESESPCCCQTDTDKDI